MKLHNKVASTVPVFALCAALTTTMMVSTASGQDGWDLQPRPVPRIPAGTTFTDRAPQGWSSLIMFVNGKLSSGDVDAASATVKKYAAMFNLVMMGNAGRQSNGQYYLDKVAIGFSTRNQQGQNVVVTANGGGAAGIGFIGKSVLAGNEEALGDIRQTARNATSVVIDAPAMMLVGNEHKERIIRYLIWVAPRTGRIGTTCWVLDKTRPPAGYRVGEDTFQFLPPNMIENRVLNVKRDYFTLGIPSPKAFAMVRIPQGTAYKFTPQMLQQAGARAFTKESFHSLLTATSGAFAQRTARGF